VFDDPPPREVIGVEVSSEHRAQVARPVRVAVWTELEGFEPVGIEKSWHRTGALLDRPRVARIAHDPEDDDVLLLVRADGRWPAPDRVSWNGAAPVLEPFEFVVPYPLDGRLVAALLAGPDESDPPPGCAQIWLSGGGPVEFDTGAMESDVRAQLDELGYVGDED